MPKKYGTREQILYRLQKAADITGQINLHLTKALELSQGRSVTLVKNVPLAGGAVTEMGKLLQKIHDEFKAE